MAMCCCASCGVYANSCRVLKKYPRTPLDIHVFGMNTPGALGQAYVFGLIVSQSSMGRARHIFCPGIGPGHLAGDVLGSCGTEFPRKGQSPETRSSVRRLHLVHWDCHECWYSLALDMATFEALPDLLIGNNLRIQSHGSKLIWCFPVDTKSGALSDHFEVMHSSMRTTLVQAGLSKEFTVITFVGGYYDDMICVLYI